jgi:hypothetical protein
VIGQLLEPRPWKFTINVAQTLRPGNVTISLKMSFLVSSLHATKDDRFGARSDSVLLFHAGFRKRLAAILDSFSQFLERRDSMFNHKECVSSAG